mmetsp:Transcript_27709/g.72768  ORF Transcript_27709/g.72768 Transcript_27709/m.72768 type:complete len:271 (+) Transcript_27709:240-1052(+)|eukprot:CAMPEP_0182918042 /NCGR_PEP_ID=MMETSP0105_2-20130417/1849_1 /TAXON_ID=81532 ORGANISM="Acanthoeca-like sp., Strain 10tr" /NCGR_SAMPLE_ID=MMETSP0105_2 /ASSEMBLY_ACC=CAM_ASM_000205 /LENGTH=270 /DNA_ID=CAMNT_0025055073 /DNA_START=219 /DNA_END=1031 /DNA_ORIENTATION=+
MSVEEIKELVAKSLQQDGVLPKIQAELRASVFHSLDKHGYTVPGGPRRQPPRITPRLSEFVESADGRLVVNLVREFLEHFELDFTQSVLVPEAGLSEQPFPGRHSLQGEIPGRINNGPLLMSLLSAARQTGPTDFVPARAADGSAAAMSAQASNTQCSTRGAPTSSGQADFAARPALNLAAGTTSRPDKFTALPAVGDADKTPVPSGDEISEEYSDDFTNGTETDESAGLPFRPQPLDDKLDDSEHTEDLSIVSGNTENDFDMRVRVPRP